jgi:CheY-like chemotaxis protein
MERTLTDLDRIHIAVAEDDPMDLMWLKTHLDHLGLDYELNVALDGEEARDFILKDGKYRNSPPAHVIFPDMNMPKLTGLDSAPPDPGFGRTASLRNL